jgi:hypothetical protein
LREALSTEEGREMLEEALKDKLNDGDHEADTPFSWLKGGMSE